MKPQVRVNFAYFWPGFTPDNFRAFFPFAYEKYDLILSPEPEIVFYSVFAPQFRPYADPRHHAPVARIHPGKYLRVFFSGENFEPDMERVRIRHDLFRARQSPQSSAPAALGL